MADYRQVVTTALDTAAVLAVAVGAALGLLPYLGLFAVAVGGAVLYAGLHMDAPLLVVRRALVATVGWVRRRRAPAKARRVERAAAAARAARELTVRRPWRPPAPVPTDGSDLPAQLKPVSQLMAELREPAAS